MAHMIISLIIFLGFCSYIGFILGLFVGGKKTGWVVAFIGAIFGYFQFPYFYWLFPFQ